MAAFWLLLVGKEDEPSPAAVAVDELKRWMIVYMGAGGRKERLALVGRTVADVVTS